MSGLSFFELNSSILRNSYTWKDESAYITGLLKKNIKDERNKRKNRIK